MQLLLRFSLPPLSPAPARRLPVTPRFPFPPPILSLPSARSPPCRCACSPFPDPGARDATFDEELGCLLALLPAEMRRRADAHPELRHLVEVVMDVGRRPLARFPSGDFVLSDRPISSPDLLRAAAQVGDFTADNRAGISRTLHRISAIRNRKGAIIGLTCRVGRAVTGSADLLRDLVEDGRSLLLIGPPGVGKTTIIREVARMLADDYKKRVMIVDTSNEIGGDGDIPHAGIGNARRLQVPDSNMQHKVLIEAVENHMPHVIVIDEIGTKLEAIAASTIAQRGIQLVATAHGVTIENLIMNPSLEMLVGGIQSVTLGDEEASRRGVQKTILERKGPSTFSRAAEIISKTELRVHRNLEATVDALLAGRSPLFDVRELNLKSPTSEIPSIQSETLDDIHSFKEDMTSEDHVQKNDERMRENVCNLEFAEKVLERSCEPGETKHVYVYGISEASVTLAIKQLGMDGMIVLTDNISEADAFLALHSKLKKNSQIQAVARSHDIPIYVTKTSSLVLVTKAIRALIKKNENGLKVESEGEVSSSEKLDALEEARLAIEQVVIPLGESVQLLPRPSFIIYSQIELIEQYKLKWEKIDQRPKVCVRILPFPAYEGKHNNEQTIDTSSRSQNPSSSDDINTYLTGVGRLPLLPD